MEWQKISAEDYKSIFKESQTVFHSADFNLINEEKAQTVLYLSYKTELFILGCILGLKSGTWHSPFSSPFGGIEIIGEPSDRELEKAISALTKIIDSPIFITLAPNSYTPFVHTAKKEQFLEAGFKTSYADSSYHLNLTDGNFEDRLERNARKNLNKAKKINHAFHHASNLNSQERAYSIIYQNRKEKGFPLRMSFDQIRETNKIIPLDFYILEMNSKACASALVYKLNDKIAMVVYWGHLESFSEYRPMNLLASFLYNKYKNIGYSILDIGPSSENGIINEGLAKFKLSLGCIQSEKVTLRYD